MKVIIAGGREITDLNVLDKALLSCSFFYRFLEEDTEIVTGGALGVDTMGDNWAKEQGIDRVVFPANWKKHGKSAGYQRNKKMLDYIMLSYPDCGLIAIPGEGKGTPGMIKLCREAGIGNIHIYEIS